MGDIIHLTIAVDALFELERRLINPDIQYNLDLLVTLNRE